MRHRWIFWAIVILSVMTCLPVARMDDTAITTTSPIPENTTNTTQTPAPAPPITTEKAKIKILESSLCKKCDCDETNKQLDCSTKLKDWFTAEEWDMLQNGDIVFETIRMEHNNLTTVPQIPEYPVKNLHLAFNQIETIAMAAFQNLSEIAKIDLSHNMLTTKVLVPDIFKGKYSPDYYQPLEHMKELDLGHNDLHTLDADLFEHLPGLEVLVLCKNIFQVIDQLAEAAIAGLASLKTLDMSYMELRALPENFLHGPRELEKLILTGNLFDKLSPHLDYASNLKELMLDENPITDMIADNVFPLLPNLEFLSISYMPDLTKIGEGALQNLPKLSMLLASNNPKLTTIDAKAFTKATVNPQIYDYPPLNSLYIHNNNLSTFERDWIVRWDKVNTIDARYNPWLCDCSNSYFIHTLMAQINTTTPMLTTDITCAAPTDFKGVHLKDIPIGTGKQELNCGEIQAKTDSLMLVGLFVGILIGIPLTIGSFLIYRRGCFGLIKQNGQNSLYNRASFSDDFHI